MDSLEEKRQFPRLNLHTPVRCQYKSFNKFNFTLTRDISEGGLKFVSEEFMPPKTYLVLEFNLSSQAGMIKAVAKAVWIQQMRGSDWYSIGIQFLDINPETKKEIAHYVETELKFTPPGTSAFAKASADSPPKLEERRGTSRLPI